MKNKKKLYILSGVPGCGKSTWARKMVENDNSIEIVSRDKIRFSMVKEENGYFSQEDKVFNRYVEDIILSLLNLMNTATIADATQVNAISRAKLVMAIQKRWPDFENEVDIIIVYFHVPFETCVARNNTRTGRECVPMDAMKRMNRQHELPAIEYKNHVATYIVRD